MSTSNSSAHISATATQDDMDQDGISVSEFVAIIRPHFRKIAALAVVGGAIAYGISHLIAPTFTARTVIVSPQQQQNAAAAALASLGNLAGLAGGSSAIKSPADQYISIMQSVTVGNRIIDRFKLMDLYAAKFRVDALNGLSNNVRISTGKKDNLITIDVDDQDPARAAQIANAYVEELRWVTNNLALTEAQQRRAFFQQQLRETKDALQAAQLAVQKTGFTAGALKSEPKAAAEAYARTKADIAAAEVRLGVLRKSLADSAPEVQQQITLLSGLRAQLAASERPLDTGSSQDYVSAYREFKYQEALFEIYAKQLELAKMDEAREGTLIQVLDAATPPERKSKPRRAAIAVTSTIVVGLLLTAFFGIRGLRRRYAPV
jgi:uncharacterized protein involved in exopolysaccharide biosynthesis